MIKYNVETVGYRPTDKKIDLLEYKVRALIKNVKEDKYLYDTVLDELYPMSGSIKTIKNLLDAIEQETLDKVKNDL